MGWDDDPDEKRRQEIKRLYQHGLFGKNGINMNKQELLDEENRRKKTM